ncbi:hypothetical protein GCM10022379_18200 [Micromonospora maritima]
MGQNRHGPAYALWVAMERYRRDNRLTLEQFAARARVGRQTLDRLKDSRTPPRTTTVHKIAGAMGMRLTSAEELAGLTPAGGERAPTAEDRSSESGTPAPGGVDTREAIMRDPRLNDEGRRVVLAAYDAIASAFNPPPRAAEEHEERRRAG